MKLLLTPMSTLAETGGSMTRTRAIAMKALEKGHDAAFCSGEDLNYRPLNGVMNYPAPIPSPCGLPLSIGKKLLTFAQRIGIQARIAVRDFEQVLQLIGALDKDYFTADVEDVRSAIRHFEADVVFTEHRLAPIVAARLERVKSVTSYSTPIERSRHNPCCGRYSNAVKHVIQAYQLPAIRSVLDIYDWSLGKIIPSSPELEPVDDKQVQYVGALLENHTRRESLPGKNILAYMGNGTISAAKLYRIVREAFGGTDYQVFLATKALKPCIENNIHVDRRFDFHELLQEAAMVISHGGQNSMTQSLLHGVPLLVCPGKIFERQYNAKAIARLGAGKVIREHEFTARAVRNVLHEYRSIPSFRENARKAGTELHELGGAGKLIEILESL